MGIDRTGRNASRIMALAACVLLLGALPAIAQQGSYTGHCRRMTKQIERYKGDIELARVRGNPVWEASTRAHVDRLRDRRSQLCPEYDQWVVAAAAQRSAEEMAALMRLAARAAIAYFTGGLY